MIQRFKPQALRRKYEIQQDDLDVLIRGRSIIDTKQGLSASSIRTLSDVDAFAKSYGYDLDNPIENAEILGNFHEAINFVRKYFLQPENPEGLKLEIPRKILELTDIRELFLMANMTFPGQVEDTQGSALRNWACSLLKVVHTIAHIDKDLRASYFADIQKQIFDRFYKVIHRDGEGQLFLGEKPEDPFRVDLVGFETKPKKKRESILLKLLHKPENVAEELFDRVGIRFITHTALDAIRVVKYLKDALIVVPANAKPSRSRNSLLNLDETRRVLTSLLDKLDSGELDEKGLHAEIEKIPRPSLGGENKHSSDEYRSIQFTCRQLIKFKNPIFEDVKELRNLAKVRTLPDEVVRIVERMDPKYLQREVRFFYPFEVQIMDNASAEENEKGRSAHSEYKKAQIQTALKRVMGSFLDAG